MTTAGELAPVQLAHGVVLCAVVGTQLVIGEVGGHSDLLSDILDYAEEVGCSSVVFHTSRKGLLIRTLDLTNARHSWTAPTITGYIVEVRREAL